MSDLKPCPFCGERCRVKVERTYGSNTLRGGVFVQCSVCDAGGPQFGYGIFGIKHIDRGTAEKKAVQAWNSLGNSSRVPTPKMIKYMCFIERYSGVTPPFNASLDFNSCAAYIAKYKAIAHKKHNDGVRHTPISTDRKYHWGFSEYTMVDEDSGITCFDAGISPFGNS